MPDDIYHSRAIPSGGDLDRDPEVMIHQQLARMRFFEGAVGWSGKSVLDYGCGSGFNSRLLASASEYLGFDLSPDVVNLAVKLNPGGRFVAGDGCDRNLNLGAWERIICCEVLEHVPDMPQLLANIRRHLAPGGIAFISTPNVEVFSGGHRPSPINREHVYEPNLAEFRSLLRHFSEVRIYGQRFVRPELLAAWTADVARKTISLEAGTRWPKPKPAPPSLRRLRAFPPLLWAWRLVRRRLWAAWGRRAALRARPYAWQDFTFSEEILEDAVWFCAICKA